MLLPAASRDAYFAVRAFNVELASIKDGHNIRNRGMAPPDNQLVASSGIPPTFALQMRMHWWRNAIDAIYNNDRENRRQHQSSLAGSLSISCWNSPVVRAMDRANVQWNWTRRFLERMLDAREIDLEHRQPRTVNDCVAYADETVSSLLYLTLECTGVRDDAADRVAGLAGIGIGLATTQLRATPFRLLHGGEVPLPAELFRPDFPYHQLLPKGEPSDRDIVLTESDGHMLRDAVRHVAHTATQHLIEAQTLQGQVPRAGRVCLLPVIPALTYLSKLEHADYNLFDASVTSGSPSDRLKLLFRLGRTWATGVF